MSLLDSDAEELKNRAALPSSGSTGRKTNQSGLGAFKTLSKYSNLTAKYRKNGTQENSGTQNPSSVEQFRGTFSKDLSIDSKSVQTQSEIAPTINKNKFENSQCEVSASSHNVSIENLNQKSVQSGLDAALTIDSDDLIITSIIDEHYPINQSQCVAEPTNISFDYKELSFECVNAPTLNPTDNKLISNESNDVIKTNLLDHTQYIHAPTSTYDEDINSQCDVSAPSKDPSIENSELKSVRELPDLEIKSKIASKLEKQIRQTSEVGTYLSAKSVQLKNKPSALPVQTQGEVSSKVGAKLRPIQFDTLVPQVSILTLSGAQRQILEFLFDQCVWNNSLITPPITKEQLITATNLKEETAISSVKRLRSKLLVDRFDYKDGKAGWTRYQLAEITYKELLNFRNTNSTFATETNFLPGKVSAKVGATVSANLPSKIDSNINNITNYTNAPTYTSSWFKTLNFAPVHPINPMQVNSSIRRLVEEKLDQDDAQNFINRFMTWLSGQGRVNSPIAIFCDKFKEYANEGDSAILYVKTQEEIKIELELAQKAEKMRLEIELIERTKSFEKSKQDDLTFENWYSMATDEELLHLQQPNALFEFKSEIYKKTIKGIYFEKLASSNS